MKLFDVGKIGLTLDTITHSTEKRREEEVKIVSLVLRVQPFDMQLASALAGGVAKATLFRLNDGDAKDDLIRRADFTLGVPRQNLLVFASPDTDKPSIHFEQARIVTVYARTEKGVAGYALVIKVSFGPLGRTELEFIQDWHLTQRFVSFEPAEPGMFDDDTVDEDEGDEDETIDPLTGLPMDGPPPPMFDDAGRAIDEPDAANRPLHSHQQKRGRRKGAAEAAGDPVGVK